MGIDSFVRAYLKRHYTRAFSFTMPNNHSIVIMDLMEHMKSVPKSVITLDDLTWHLVNKIKVNLFKKGNVRVLVVLVDKDPPPVKRMVEHENRYKGKDVLDPKDGPYLPVKGTDLIVNPWIRFAGSYINLQRELYPRLLNAFMDPYYITPRPGQSIIFHGFPGYCEYETVFKQQPYALEQNSRGEVKRIHQWNVATELPITEEMEKRDKDLYNRVFIYENVVACEMYPRGFIRKEEYVDAKNSINEADGAMFFYDHYFQNENILYCCNDGDIFPYGILYGFERIVKGTFRNIHYACLPYKKEKDNEFFADGDVPDFEYVDLNMLYILICDDINFKAAGVQTPIGTMAFLIIMGGSDFFHDYMKDLGAEKVIWATFFKCLKLFSHMIQIPQGVTPSTRTPRPVILDEELFRLFVLYCYIEKYGDSIEKEKTKQSKKKRKNTKIGLPYSGGPEITLNDLKLRCKHDAKGNPRDDTDLHVPSRNTIRLWSRQVLWNLLYFKNAPFGAQHVPDPFELYDGVPYYPYVRDAETGKPKMIDVVCARQKPVDEVHSQWLYRNRRKDKKTLTQEKKQKIIEEFDE